MGWIIFVGYLFYGALTNLFIHLEKSAPEGSSEKKNLSRVVNGLMCIGIISLAIFLLYCIGWIWYFCGGFLVFEDQPFWDKVICGLISLIPLGFLFGFVMVCFGWDPDR